jgi:hypothetical protein
MRRLFSTTPLVGALMIVALPACSSDPAGPSPSVSSPSKAAPDRGAAEMPSADAPKGLADLKVPKEGFQVRSLGADIGPGEDVEYCEIAELPGDPTDVYYANSIELANAEFSHHLVVATALPNTPADAALRAMNIGDKVQCNGTNYEWPQEGLVFVASAQTPYIARNFPEGVGSVLYGNQRAVFDYHYLNTGEETVHAQSAINVHTVDGSTIEHIATAFSFFNFTVNVPPHASGSFAAECHFNDDLTVSSLVRHTHQQGRDFSVWFSGGANDQDFVWTSHDWKNEPGYDFTPPISLKAGEGFKFQCDFENQGDTPLRYGIKGTDEMCILAGWFWPSGNTRELPPQNCGITWLDRQGVGHPANEDGGFPPANASDAQICRAGVKLEGYSDLDPTCTSCMCDSCGKVLLACVGDADCSALVDCFSNGCTDETDCIQSCKQELHDHSSAVGMMEQVQACVSSKCAGCGPASMTPITAN